MEKPALIVPRVEPRREQLIRAERLSALGLLEYCHPHGAHAEALEEWMAREPVRPGRVRERIDFDGLSRLPAMVARCAPARAELSLAAR